MKKYINIDLLDMDTLNKIIKISTMSATCKLGSNIMLEEMFKYLKLEEGNIVTIKYKGDIKSLEPLKKKRNTKKKKNSFQNQLTIEVRPDVKKFPENKISVKIFKNGSIQMSGVKSLDACNHALVKLIDRVTKEYGVIVDGVMKDISFVENKQDININGFKIDMINSNFNIGFEINRENLHEILLKKKIQCRYEPCIHACVNIKFHPEGAIKNVSIFVFQSGNIIITGAKNTESIVESYKYIKEMLIKYKNDIQKTKIPDMIFTKDRSKKTDAILSKLLIDVDNDNLADLANNLTI
jgi:TATA-box binding protein (TBP) (component of TFIID and TFIIIB)